MRAIEVTGTIDDQGNLSLDKSIATEVVGPVRVIILCLEESPQVVGQDSDDTPIEEVRASLKRALQEAQTGQRIPISRMWEGVNDQP